MMPRWLPSIFAACLVQRATALVAVPNVEHLAVQEARRRTAQVGGFGEVSFEQQPGTGQSIITGLVDTVVSGSIVLLVPSPAFFARDSNVRNAVQRAITRLAEAQGLSVRGVNVAMFVLDDFSHGARINFETTFTTLRDRQAFTLNVTTGGGGQLADVISEHVPVPYRGSCWLPGPGELFDGNSGLQPMGLISSVASDSQIPVFRAYGTIFLRPLVSPLAVLRGPLRLESVAMAIAQVAWVSRLQVGILAAVDSAEVLRVDFWLTGVRARFGQAAIERVTSAGNDIWTLADSHASRWLRSKKLSAELVAYGRIMLKVPNPQGFARDTSIEKAVGAAVAQVAAAPGPEGSRLAVTNVRVSLAAIGDAADAVRVGFEVAFKTPRDRQVFLWDFARDGGELLAKTIVKQVPSACAGSCRLLEPQMTKAFTATPDADRNKQYGSMATVVSWPDRLAADPAMQEAVASAIAKMASVPHQQVGILLSAEPVRLGTEFWVASTNAALRQAAVERINHAAPNWFERCVLAHLDIGHRRARGENSADAVSGSFVLQVPVVAGFADSEAVRDAVRSAIARVAAVPDEQVQQVEIIGDLWDRSLKLVRVDFWVLFGFSVGREAISRALARDGGEKLVELINERVPEPFRGKCRLPEQGQAQVSGAMARPKLGLPYGTILIYVFLPQRYVRESAVREAVSRTIAEVASVPRAQVVTMMTMESGSLVSVDFWVASVDANLRQASIERVNRGWGYKEYALIRDRANSTFVSSVYGIQGGTVAVRFPPRYWCPTR